MGSKKAAKLSGDGTNKTVLHEQLLLEEIKLRKMKELRSDKPTKSETGSEGNIFSGDNVSSALNNLTAQVQQSMQPGPISPSVTTTAAAGINLSARLQQMLDATTLSNMPSRILAHNTELATTSHHHQQQQQMYVRKTTKKSLDKKVLSAPYPKTYRQVWPIVPVSDGDFMKNFGLEAVCHYFDSKWQMEHLVKQKNASASSKPVCNQCKCDFASAWQVRKSNAHSLLLCESCDFKNLKTLQREKIANHLKELGNIIAAQDSPDSRGDDLSDGAKYKMPQRASNKASKFRVDRPLDATYQHPFKTPQQQQQQQPKLTGQVAPPVIQLPGGAQYSIETMKQQQQKVKKSDEKKSKSSLKDKLDLISKQLLEKRLQESLVDSAVVVECETLPGNSSTAADSDSTNSPSRTRSRKQGAPKAMRKPSSSEITSTDSSSVVNV